MDLFVKNFKETFTMIGIESAVNAPNECFLFLV